MAAENRYTLREIAGMVAARKAVHGLAFHAIAGATCIGKAADPKWEGRLVMSSLADSAPSEQFVIADDSGKIKMFQTLDQLVKAVATVAESSIGGYGMEMNTGAVFASKVPVNIYTDAENKIIKLNKVKTAQTAKQAALVALTSAGGAMFGWDTGNAAQVSRYEEVVAQAAAINRDVDAITAEVTRLQGVVDSNPAP